MNLIDVALVISLIVALYNLQQIKITLKQRGYPVEMLSGWIEDYRQFKKLIQKEPDEKIKIQYQKILNGLHVSLAGSIALIVMILRNRL